MHPRHTLSPALVAMLPLLPAVIRRVRVDDGVLDLVRSNMARRLTGRAVEEPSPDVEWWWRTGAGTAGFCLARRRTYVRWLWRKEQRSAERASVSGPSALSGLRRLRTQLARSTPRRPCLSDQSIAITRVMFGRPYLEGAGGGRSYRLPSHLHKQTKRVQQSHLLRAPAWNLQQRRITNQHRQTPRS